VYTPQKAKSHTNVLPSALSFKIEKIYAISRCYTRIFK